MDSWKTIHNYIKTERKQEEAFIESQPWKDSY